MTLLFIFIAIIRPELRLLRLASVEVGDPLVLLIDVEKVPFTYKQKGVRIMIEILVVIYMQTYNSAIFSRRNTGM